MGRTLCKFQIGWNSPLGNFRENSIFANNVKIHILRLSKFATRAWLTYISKRKSDLAISREFYFHQTSHMQSLAKIKTLAIISAFTVYSKTVKSRSTWCVEILANFINVIAITMFWYLNSMSDLNLCCVRDFRYQSFMAL